MCILFLYKCDEVSRYGYRLIIATNRDESWDRPTKQAAFWEDNDDILGGLDLKWNIKNGTWLAMSKKGKIGITLTYMDVLKTNKWKRGRLATDFLTCDLSGEDYIAQHVQPVAKEYFSFNLLLLDLRASETLMTYFNNKDREIQNVKKNILALDNGTLRNPWQKTVRNISRFEEIVETNGSVESKEKLVSNLLDHLCDMQQYEEDKQLREQAALRNMPENVTCGLSSCFAFAPSIRFGTRTNTIILVDHQGKCEFIERTLKCPIDPGHMEWETNRYQFCMNDDAD